MYVFVPPSPPSAQARELGAKVAELVRLLRQENPDLSPGDVRQGLRLAEYDLRSEIGGLAPQIIALVLALVLGCGVFIAVYVQSPGPGSGPGLMLPILIGVVLVALAIAAVLLRRR